MHPSIVKSTLFLALGAASLTAAGDQPDQVAEAITRLGHRQFDVRQEATDYLWSLGEKASPALKEAAVSANPEVRLRARSILEKHSYGIFAHTPDHEVRLIDQFRQGNETERRKAYQLLTKEGSVPTLLALLARAGEGKLRYEFRELVLKRLEKDRDVNQLLTLARRWRGEAVTDRHRERIEACMRRQVPRLIVDGLGPEAESILKEAATSDAGMRDWAVYLALQEKLKSELQTAQSAGSTLTQHEIKQQLYYWRVQGAPGESEQFAQLLDESSQNVVRGVLFEQRNWATLAEMLLESKEFAAGEEIEPLGYAAAFCRLSGNDEGLELAVEKIKELAGNRTAMEWNCAEALLINYRIDEGIDILRSRWPAIAFEMLCIQERYAEAFELTGMKDPSGDSQEWFAEVASKAAGRTQSVNRKFELAVQVARTLHHLGEIEQALAGFETLARAVRDERGSSRLHEICKAQYRAGLWEPACRNGAIILNKGKYPDPLPTLFPRTNDLARIWLEFFQKRQSQSTSRALLKIGQLLNTRSPESIAEMGELASKAAEYAQQFDDPTRAQWLFSIGRTCELQTRTDLALRYFQDAAPHNAAAALKLADLAAGDKQWGEAAKRYKHAMSLDGDSSLARYMYGYALQQDGDDQTGQREMQLARLLPLAQSDARRRLAAGLKQRGLQDEAIKQWNLVMRSGGFLVSLKHDFSDTSLIDAVQNVGNSYKYPLGRATYWEIMHLSCLERPLWIPSYRGYFHTPHILHKTRAQAWLRDGLSEDAIREIKFSQQFMPGNIELAEHLVPRLEEADQQAAADDLFETTFDFVLKITELFPNSPLHHNNLAWLCARCDRRLDTALAHVERALELAPENASYIDTLGEVRFRRGEFDEAIECAKRCLKIEPENDFFREQLERFQQARDPS